MDLPATPAPRAGFGDILNRTWDIFAAQYKIVVPLVVVVYLPIQIVTTLAQNSSEVTRAVWFVAGAIVGLLGPLWVLSCVTRLVEQVFHGAPTIDFKKLIALGVGWYRVLATSLIEALIVLGLGVAALLLGLGATRLVPSPYGALVGVLCMVVWVLGIAYLGVRWTFAAVISVLTNRTGWPALRASDAVVSGQWWRVFGNTLLLTLIIAAVSLVIALPYGIVTSLTVGQSAITELLFSIITDVLVAFGLIFTPVMYLQLQKEKGE